LNARGERHVAVGARDLDLAGLERLPQRIQHRPLEFGQFVEEQHAQMREADLARPHLEPAPDQSRHRRRMMRAAERPRARQPAAVERSGDARHHRHLERFGRRQVRQDAGQACRH